jgi:carbon-monoxide dehydrogenase medium subunit
VHVPPIELHEVTTLDEAAALLDRHAPDVRVLAGGTDVLVDLKTGRSRVGHLVAIGAIDALRGIEASDASDASLRIGALTTVGELDRSSVIGERWPVIRETVRAMAAPQVRNAATVGGNLAGAVPCADLPPVLMVLGASVLLRSPAGERSVPVRDLFLGPRRTVLGHDELLVAVMVPNPPRGFGAAYARLGLRDGNAIAVAAVAVGLVRDGDGTVRDARLALGAVAPTPLPADAAAAGLLGRRLDDAALEGAAEAAMGAARPISDIRGSAAYRRELVGTLTRRALVAAWERAGEALP